MNKLALAVVLVAALAGCSRMDSQELAAQVKSEMLRDLVKDEALKDLKLSSVTLVEKGENTYVGIGKGDVRGIPVTFDVKCDYDGKSIIWTAGLQDSVLVRSQLKGKDLAEKTSQVWEETKTAVKEGYDKVADQTGKVYGQVKQKVTEAATNCVEAVKEAVR